MGRPKGKPNAIKVNDIWVEDSETVHILFHQGGETIINLEDLPLVESYCWCSTQNVNKTNVYAQSSSRGCTALHMNGDFFHA